MVGGMTTYEDLADATLPHGLMPLVVPQLKTITLGGAVTGLGIESTSLRNGLPHESVLAMEILTGDGRVVTATAGQRARRPVPRLPELLRHAGLRAVAHHRAGAGRAVRAPAALPRSRDPAACYGRRSRRSRRTAATRATGPTSWTAPCSAWTRCTSPWARSATWRRGTSDYTRRPDLLPVAARAPRGLPHHPRLPVALGHRLVLVLAAVRRAEPGGPRGSGRAGTGARTCTAGWSPSTGGTACPTR